MGIFNRACNLIDEDRRIIALVLPELGNGPFAISIPGKPGWFDLFRLQQPAWGNHRSITVDPWHISLGEADVWEPKITVPDLSLNFGSIIDSIEHYAAWDSLDKNSPTGQVGHRAAACLKRAITARQSGDLLQTAVGQLAGLGQGLTPAGDDYLLGVMAALWLTGQTELLSEIAEAATTRTTALSVAFLRAAARGEFMEAWHSLAQAWVEQDHQAIGQTVDRIARFGASSGPDALAGLAQTLVALSDN